MDKNKNELAFKQHNSLALPSSFEAWYLAWKVNKPISAKNNNWINTNSSRFQVETLQALISIFVPSGPISQNTLT